ncbi:hypothetical protein, partial [Sutterella parvirubra]|uniref:hypothetical protein n=1 Tax=Sutterella parvirubra TaxID=437898 RepID=UPI001C11FC7A
MLLPIGVRKKMSARTFVRRFASIPSFRRTKTTNGRVKSLFRPEAADLRAEVEGAPFPLEDPSPRPRPKHPETRRLPKTAPKKGTRTDMHTESPVGHALTSAAVETPAFVIDDA